MSRLGNECSFSFGFSLLCRQSKAIESKNNINNINNNNNKQQQRFSQIRALLFCNGLRTATRRTTTTPTTTATAKN